jgi:DNA-binding Xre family transcriptional regulator
MKTYKLRVVELAKEHGLENANQLMKAADLNKKPAYEIWNGVSKSLTLETIGKLCTVFDCEPGDLYIEVKNKRKKG